MKRKRQDSNDLSITSLPDEIIVDILTHVPYEKGNWLHCRLVCKQFYSLCSLAQNPRVNDDRPLLWSCKEGRLHSVINLLQDKRIVVSCFNNLPIRLAALYGNAEIVKILLKIPGVEPRDLSPPGNTFEGEFYVQFGKNALYLAIDSEDIVTVCAILESPNYSPRKRETERLLSFFCRKGQWQAVRSLRKASSHSEPSNIGELVQSSSPEHDNHLLYRELLQYSGITEASEKEALRVHSGLGHHLIVVELLKNPALEPFCGLHLDSVISKGHCKVVQIFLPILQKTKGPTSWGLKTAIEHGQKEIVKSIVLQCKNLDDTTIDEALEWSIDRGDSEIFTIFAALKPPKHIGLFMSDLSQDRRCFSKDPIILDWVVNAFLVHCEQLCQTVVVEACKHGDIETAKAFLRDSRFLASEPQMRYILDSIKEAE